MASLKESHFEVSFFRHHYRINVQLFKFIYLFSPLLFALVNSETECLFFTKLFREFYEKRANSIFRYKDIIKLLNTFQT